MGSGKTCTSTLPSRFFLGSFLSSFRKIQNFVWVRNRECSVTYSFSMASPPNSKLPKSIFSSFPSLSVSFRFVSKMQPANLGKTLHDMIGKYKISAPTVCKNHCQRQFPQKLKMNLYPAVINPLKWMFSPTQGDDCINWGRMQMRCTDLFMRQSNRNFNIPSDIWLYFEDYEENAPT